MLLGVGGGGCRWWGVGEDRARGSGGGGGGGGSMADRPPSHWVSWAPAGPAATSPLGQALNFLDQLQQDNWQLVLFALAGGACLALGGERRGLCVWFCARLCKHRGYIAACMQGTRVCDGGGGG
jgi:hypothetical protein